MVVAQLVEQSLPTPEVHGSNPVIGKIYIDRILKRRKYRKIVREWPIYKENIIRTYINRLY